MEERRDASHKHSENQRLLGDASLGVTLRGRHPAGCAGSDRVLQLGTRLACEGVPQCGGGGDGWRAELWRLAGRRREDIPCLGRQHGAGGSFLPCQDSQTALDTHQRPPVTLYLLPLLLPVSVAAASTCAQGSGCTILPTWLPRAPLAQAPPLGAAPALAQHLLGLPLHSPISASQPFATGGLWFPRPQQRCGPVV